VKLQMAKNSLFGILLRSPWWISLLVAGALALLTLALLPKGYEVIAVTVVGPFLVIAAMAAWKQSKLPSAARVEQTTRAAATMAWPEFAGLLEQAFGRDGYAVQRDPQPGVDFALERQGKRTFVSARRWKSARTGLETLRALQTARAAADVSEAVCICLADPSENARSFATRHQITVWQAAELAQALRGLPLPAAR
jgi:restriction system protein